MDEFDIFSHEENELPPLATRPAQSDIPGRLRIVQQQLEKYIQANIQGTLSAGLTNMGATLTELIRES